MEDPSVQGSTKYFQKLKFIISFGFGSIFLLTIFLFDEFNFYKNLWFWVKHGSGSSFKWGIIFENIFKAGCMRQDQHHILIKNFM